jgi:hypothetical protein
MSEEKLTTAQRIKLHKPLEVWEEVSSGWRWEVYRKYQKPEKEATNPYARWNVITFSPIVPEGEGPADCYVSTIKRKGVRIK